MNVKSLFFLMPILGLFLYLWRLILIRVFMENSDLRNYAVCSVIVDHFKTALWRNGHFYIFRPSHCDYHCDDCAFQIDCEAIVEGPRLCEILFGKQCDGFSIGIL